MSGAMIGGNIRYPTLQGICDLFRTQINDTFSNNSGTGTGQGGGSGLVMNNTNPDTLTFLNAACLDMFAELRNVGSPELILDNYNLIGIPALGVVDPTVQVALSYAGYFNGFTWTNQWTLPIGLSRMISVSQRQTNSGFGFDVMPHCATGLPSCMQGQLMGGWEMRQGLLWMTGAVNAVDISLRCRITFPPFLSTAATVINFSTAYVPILDSLNAIAAKMLVLYARRFAPEQLTVAKDAEATSMGKLRLESVRERQSEDNEATAFGDAAMQSFPGAWVSL
jgi:hypothetical protein